MALDTKTLKKLRRCDPKLENGKLADGWMLLPTFRSFRLINRLAQLAHMLLALSPSTPCAG